MQYISNSYEDTINIAKQFAKTEAAERFMKQLPHEYYEENNLHAFLIEQMTDFTGCIGALNEFLPYMDNWSTCDMEAPKTLRRIYLNSGNGFRSGLQAEILTPYVLVSIC